MRIAIIVVAVILGVIFIGGAVNLGSAPLFGHLDRAFGTNALMQLHYTIFSFAYRGQSQSESEPGAGDGRSEFEKRPLGIDKEKNYRRIDDAGKY
jgi:hypothetical protein